MPSTQGIERLTRVQSPLCSGDNGAEPLIVELSFVGRVGEEIAGSGPESLESDWKALQNVTLRRKFLIHALLQTSLHVGQFDRPLFGAEERQEGEHTSRAAVVVIRGQL